jgi:hypothetical protein
MNVANVLNCKHELMYRGDINNIFENSYASYSLDATVFSKKDIGSSDDILYEKG